jgi:predicted ArsR family transcriptional regulator
MAEPAGSREPVAGVVVADDGAPATARGRPVRYRLDAEDRAEAERGLATLVLTVVELLRDLMERQAIRRVEDGSVTDEQAERLGHTLMLLNERMDELVEKFGIRREDLNLDLGPLGTLLPDQRG